MSAEQIRRAFPLLGPPAAAGGISAKPTTAQEGVKRRQGLYALVLFLGGGYNRAYPDERLSGLLPQWIGCQRAIYNAKVLEDRQHALKERRR